MSKIRVPALIVGFLVLVGLGGWRGEKSKPADRVGEVLWWLPADTQTVIVARGPFKVPKRKGTAEGIGLLRTMQMMISANIPDPNPDELTRIIQTRYNKEAAGSV